MNSVLILRVVLLAYTAVFAVYYIKDCVAHKDEFKNRKFVALAIIGFYSNFLDTLGIGSFATTQAGFKFTKSSEDAIMPGTLNVGDCIPVVLEAVLFFGLIEIDTLTLVAMIAAAIIGAIIGASIVSKWSLKLVRIALGIALIAMAIIFICQLTQFGPFGTTGDATALVGIKLVIGVVCNFFLGAFMTIGVGLYAPCTALCAALGMNVQAAFPIFMGSCAFLMPSAGMKFIKEGKYDRVASVMLTLFGCVGVMCAYLFVSSIPKNQLIIVLIFVMLFTAGLFFKDAMKSE